MFCNFRVTGRPSRRLCCWQIGPLKKWRNREVAFPMCWPTTMRILSPANLFCNMQCTTVCITAVGSRVAKRTPGTCRGGVPQRVCATSLSVDHRGLFPGYPSGVGLPQQPFGQPPESAATVTLTGRYSGSCKTGGGRGYDLSVQQSWVIKIATKALNI